MMRILVVSNRPDDLTAFVNGLGGEGVRLTFAPTGAVALAAVAVTPPTLCVVDENLPDMGPFALVARLMRANALIHTAVLSGLTEEAFHEAGEGLGILQRVAPSPGEAEAESLLAALAAVS